MDNNIKWWKPFPTKEQKNLLGSRPTVSKFLSRFELIPACCTSFRQGVRNFECIFIHYIFFDIMRTIKTRTTYYHSQLDELVLNVKVYKRLISLLGKCCKCNWKTLRRYAVCWRICTQKYFRGSFCSSWTKYKVWYISKLLVGN